MTDKSNFKDTLRLIKDLEKDGKIVLMTGMGLMECPLEKFCRQDAGGVLYDLNRDKATTITLGESGNERWINDYAVALVIEYLMNELKRLKNEMGIPFRTRVPPPAPAGLSDVWNQNRLEIMKSDTPDVIIAIDPDVDKSGVATLDTSSRCMECMAVNLPMLVDYLLQMKVQTAAKEQSLVVVVEASYLINTNWHLDWKDSQRRAAAKGKQVGRNHEIGKQIVEFCKHLQIPYEEKMPLTKNWAGKDGKITQVELESLLCGTQVSLLSGKTNQEKRDAALLALDCSGFSLRIAKKTKIDQR